MPRCNFEFFTRSASSLANGLGTPSCALDGPLSVVAASAGDNRPARVSLNTARIWLVTARLDMGLDEIRHGFDEAAVHGGHCVTVHAQQVVRQAAGERVVTAAFQSIGLRSQARVGLQLPSVVHQMVIR